MDNDQETISREAEDIVKHLGIPPCPAILTKLMQEMRADEPDFTKLGKLIGGDVSLAAAMLKTVNSPFYGLRTKATSVHQAIALLGLRNVAQLVTGLLLRQAFPGGTSDAMDEFWESTTAIAEMNSMLARKFPGVDRDIAYTFGLFRDCGILAMIGTFKGYRPVLPGSKVEGDGNITDIEDAAYGMNHALVGFHLAKSWLLPDEICLTILHHHDYTTLESDGTDLSGPGIKHIALALAAEKAYLKSEMGIESREWRKGGAFALRQLNVTQEKLDEMSGGLATQ